MSYIFHLYHHLIDFRTYLSQSAFWVNKRTERKVNIPEKVGVSVSKVTGLEIFTCSSLRYEISVEMLLISSADKRLGAGRFTKPGVPCLPIKSLLLLLLKLENGVEFDCLLSAVSNRFLQNQIQCNA